MGADAGARTPTFCVCFGFCRPLGVRQGNHPDLQCGVYSAPGYEGFADRWVWERKSGGIPGGFQVVMLS